jgi:UDP-N-acetylmuramyl pentapeptide synthase
MPPLAGKLEPVGRIVFDPQQVQPRDTYWALQVGTFDGALLVGEAFSRGALGVVLEGRKVEPWAGSFCITVTDGLGSLHRLMRCLRTDRGTWPDNVFGNDPQTTAIVQAAWEKDAEKLQALTNQLAHRGAVAA